jgi:superfamily I DNA and/or RNA helicase
LGATFKLGKLDACDLDACCALSSGLDPYFLDTQFRMHPMIAAFSAQEFYHGKLKTGVTSEQRPPPAGSGANKNT